MSIRGTQLNKGFKEACEDLTDDFFVANNNVSITRRYKESEKRLNELQAKYPDYEIDLYGHSLGGAISYELGKRYNLTTHSFSTGSGYRKTFDFGKKF
jgi:putative lipase involved disintegration of autophagic bodies